MFYHPPYFCQSFHYLPRQCSIFIHLAFQHFFSSKKFSILCWPRIKNRRFEMALIANAKAEKTCCIFSKNSFACLHNYIMMEKKSFRRRQFADDDDDEEQSFKEVNDMKNNQRSSHTKNSLCMQHSKFTIVRIGNEFLYIKKLFLLEGEGRGNGENL